MASKTLKSYSSLLKDEVFILPSLADTDTQIYIYLLVNTYVRLGPSVAGTVQNIVLIYMLHKRT